MKQLLSWVIMLFVVFIFSCKNQYEIDPVLATQTNEWVLKSMKKNYYWNDRIPSNVSLSENPYDYFDKLLYTYDENLRPDGDKYSTFFMDSRILEFYQSGSTVNFGFEYELFKYPIGSKNLVGVVLYVEPGSEADRQGIKRGDLFNKANGKLINYSTEFDEGKCTFSFQKLDQNKNLVDTGITKTVSPEIVQDNPVHFDTVLVEGDKRIGYFVYNRFLAGPGENHQSQYDKKMIDTFRRLKQKQINELVIDLRYNSGGSSLSAEVLGSLVTKAPANSVFFTYEMNPELLTELSKLYKNGFNTSRFKIMDENVGGGLNRVFILTSKKTASASELIINGLKPFMETIVIGDQTAGKNMGSYTITDSTKVLKCAIVPMMFKMYNSLHQSDYILGFKPDYKVVEDIEMYPFGDTRDKLLGKAMDVILGNKTSRINTNPSQIQAEALFSSISSKPASNILIMDFSK